MLGFNIRVQTFIILIGTFKTADVRDVVPKVSGGMCKELPHLMQYPNNSSK